MKMQLEGTVWLVQETIDRIFAEAETQWDMFKLYAAVIPDWDQVKTLDGYPVINDRTTKYIQLKAIEFDKQHHPGVLPGGLWMNRGFSSRPALTDLYLADWQVDLSNCVVTYKEVD